MKFGVMPLLGLNPLAVSLFDRIMFFGMSAFPDMPPSHLSCPPRRF
jgi:hypothetical protein